MPFWGKGSSSGGDGPNVASDSTSPSSTSSPESTPSSKPALTREQQADLDLRELLAALDSQSTAEEATRAKAQRASPTSGTQSYKYHPTSAEKKKIADEDFETGFKTEMNCLQAFDQVWYCYSLGGQFLNVYRYGSFRDCSEKSKDWRFCMKTKMYGPVTRKAMILARNKEKAAKYKTNPSSEDIWTLRKEPLDHAFDGWTEEMEHPGQDTVP